MAQAPILRFGVYEVDVRAGELRKHGTRIKVQQKPLALLLALVAHPGEVVTREELRRLLWADNTYVDFERSLSVAMGKLREALCDSAESPRYIETVPRRGYRFLLPVERIGAPRQMLAVLPFTQLKNDSADGFFADGLTDELITQLGRLNPRQLGVIARSSTMTYRGSEKKASEIARELGVEYLLEGSVQQQGKRVRIHVCLVHSADQTQLWADSYDRPTEDLLALQMDVATQVARALAIELLADPAAIARGSTKKMEARDKYLLGRAQWNQRTVQGVERALVYFRQAVEADLGFALAHTGVADAYSLLGYYGVLSPEEAFDTASASAETALAIDPELAEPHCSVAFIRLQRDWDWPAAEQEHQRALQLNENYAPAHHWYGIDLTQVGRFAEAGEALARAIALDPMDVATHSHIARLRYFERKSPEAIKALRKIVRADPGYGPAQYFLALALAQTGENDAAINSLQAAALLAPDHPATLSALAYVFGSAGRPFEARETRDRLAMLASRHYVSPYFVAFAAASTDHEATFEQLEKALAERAPWLLYLPYEPAFDGLREDTRFTALCRQLKARNRAKRAAR